MEVCFGKCASVLSWMRNSKAIQKCIIFSGKLARRQNIPFSAKAQLRCSLVHCTCVQPWRSRFTAGPVRNSFSLSTNFWHCWSEQRRADLRVTGSHGHFPLCLFLQFLRFLRKWGFLGLLLSLGAWVVPLHHLVLRSLLQPPNQCQTSPGSPPALSCTVHSCNSRVPAQPRFPTKVAAGPAF